MALLAPTSLPNAVGPRPDEGVHASWSARAGHWIASSRSHRVICLLSGIWLLNAFDLTLTVLSHQQGLLQEGNPLARHMLSFGLPSMVLYKIGLVLIGSYPLLRFRTARITELGAIVILVAYALLAVHWSTCYEVFAATTTDPRDFAGLPGSGHLPE